MTPARETLDLVTIIQAFAIETGGPKWLRQKWRRYVWPKLPGTTLPIR